MKNFFNDSTFQLLRQKMGIDKSKYASFEGLKSNPFGLKLDPIQIKKLESGGDIDITLDKLDFSENDPILRVGKVNVVLYVRDQYHPPRHEYKYHIAWCETLEKRKIDNKIDRYVITRKDDENFNVNVINKDSHKVIEKNGVLKMSVCRGCLRKINYKGYKSAGYNRNKKDNIYNVFSLEAFLKSEKVKFDYLPQYSEYTQPINQYTSNWKEISRLYRKKVNWKCEKCGRDFSSNKGNLDTHHINSSKYDVKDENLIALCKDCHKKEHAMS